MSAHRTIGRRFALPGLGLILLSATGAGTAPSTATESADPWSLLTELRDELRVESPLQASFVQSFVPSGFSGGDSESGALYVDLPRCLRFEYAEPFPKNFLLCGDWVYTWNPGEVSGRRFLTTDGEAEGLDLLRLEVEALRSRYRAELGAGEGDSTVIELIPSDPGGEIRTASVEFGPGDAAGATLRLRSLSYEDQSGNRTRFEVSSYRDLESADALHPPALEWLED